MDGNSFHLLFLSAASERSSRKHGDAGCLAHGNIVPNLYKDVAGKWSIDQQEASDLRDWLRR